jgi:hypothetical protein
MSDMQCPYCDEDVEERDDCHEPEILFEKECPHCEKTFVYSIEYSRVYYPHKADCLNGGPHDWAERRTYPEYVNCGVYKCRDCDKEETRWPERLEKLKGLLEKLKPEEEWEREYLLKYIAGVEKRLEVRP